MIRIGQVRLSLQQAGTLPVEAVGSEAAKEKLLLLLQKKAANILNIPVCEILELQLVRQSIDARKKSEIFYSYIVDVKVLREEKLLQRGFNSKFTKAPDTEYVFSGNDSRTFEALPAICPVNKRRPVITGMGPAGLFCGYMLAKHGFYPILLERGKPIEERQKDVDRFWETGSLDPESNVQFGEGGAGAFSDGKLNTLIKEKAGRNREVLKIFVENGAPEHILYENKPHLGTDVLAYVVKNMRERMLQWGAQIHFFTKMEEILYEKGKVTGVRLSDGSMLSTDSLVLAVGHSARDTFEVCYRQGIPMEAKAFAVGFRVEHPQMMINQNQFGAYASMLPAAEYKLTAKGNDGRGVYSFCMCPGGYVVNASSEPGRLAVNGMSYSQRNGTNANSAVIVSVGPDDFCDKTPLGGVAFQRKIEEAAYRVGGGRIPVQYYKDFFRQVAQEGTADLSRKAERVVRDCYVQKDFSPAMKGSYTFAPVHEILPPCLNRSILQGMEQFHRSIPGFADDFVILSGVESRTSSPLRILRDRSMQSALAGLYPCGEGAGYAGGITSAAMDGIAVAEALVKNRYK